MCDEAPKLGGADSTIFSGASGKPNPGISRASVKEDTEPYFTVGKDPPKIGINPTLPTGQRCPATRHLVPGLRAIDPLIFNPDASTDASEDSRKASDSGL